MDSERTQPKVKAGATRVIGPSLDIPATTARSRRALNRYSRFVNTAKFILPLIAGLLIALVAVWPKLQPQERQFSLGFGVSANAREAADPGMLNPRYIGIDDGNMPFSITADLAKSGSGKSGTVELEMPKADVVLEDGTWLVLTAESGVYSRDEKNLALSGAVNLFHDSGYEIRTERATIDLDRGAASGETRVDGHGPFGELRSEGFQLESKGRKIHFTGKSRLVIYPGFGAMGE